MEITNIKEIVETKQEDVMPVGEITMTNVNASLVKSSLTNITNIGNAIKEALIEGEDYGKVEGCGNKPSLLKSGATKIALMFGITSETVIDKDDCDRKNNYFYYRIKVKLYHKGVLLHEGIGCCANTEKGRGADKYGNWQPENTILKMAEKRAFVDAVLKLSNLSQLFTQDIEDFKETKPSTTQTKNVVFKKLNFNGMKGTNK